MSKVIENIVFPAAMREKLNRIRLRGAVLAAAKAIAIASSVLLVGMVVAMAIDWWFTIFSTGVRMILTTASLSLTAAILLYFSIKPIRESLGWTNAAENVDSEIPQLQERWTTVANFANSNSQPTTLTQKAMLQQVTSEAVALGQLVKPANVVRPVSLKRPLMMLGGAIVVLGAFMGLHWDQTTVLLQRFWMPMAAITATQLESATGDAIVPRGHSLEIATNMHGLQRSAATFIMEGETFPIEQMELIADPNKPGVIVCNVDVDESFRYRLLAGDGRTQWHSVTAIDFPTLAQVRLTVTPPKYVSRDVIQKTLIPGRIRVIQGSMLNLKIRPDAPLEHFELRLTRASNNETLATSESDSETKTESQPKTTQEILSPIPDADGWYAFTTPLMEDFSFSAYLRNTHGLENESRRVCRVHVIADKAPVARVISPTDEMAVSPDEEIEVQFEAHDDHGIATAELVIYDESNLKEGEEPKVLAVKQIPLGDQKLEKHVMGSIKLDLKDLNLGEGANISYAVRVTDNRELQFDSKDLEMALAKERRDEGEKSERSDEPDSAGEAFAMNDSPEEESERDTLVADSAADEPEPDSNDADSASDDSIVNENPSQLADSERKPGLEDDGEKRDESRDGKTDPEDVAAKDKSADADAEDATPGSSAEQNTERDSDKDAVDEKMAKQDNNTDGDDSNSPIAKSKDSEDPKRKTEPAENVTTEPSDNVPFPNLVNMSGLSSEGQRRETNRLRIRISEGLAAVARSDEKRRRIDDTMHEQFAAIDQLLEVAAQDLKLLVEKTVPAADRSGKYKKLDKQLGDTEAAIGELRDETRDTQFAFAGLQMVDIGRTHVTPARDMVFVAIRELDVAADVHAKEALHNVMSARELLAELLKKYERVKRDKKLADKLNEAVKMYAVYVDKSHKLMREARQNKNPLKRKMEVNEYEQSYLDRYAEVERLRREMMAEFGRILAEDPRLLARYLDLRKRRGASLREQLSQLAGRQDEITQEVSEWQRVEDAQRDGLWMLVSELRLHAASDLSKNAQALASVTEKTMPLVLEVSRGSAALVIQHSKQVALFARESQLDAKKAIQAGGDPDLKIELRSNANRLVDEVSELSAALDQLNFESESKEGVTEFVVVRQLETRALADQADAWLHAAVSIEERKFHRLALVDQQRVAIDTELLRVGLLSIEDDLEQEFLRVQQNAVDGVQVPAEVRSLAAELLQVVENITFNQSASEFALASKQMGRAAAQLEKAMDGFELAEKLLDQIRRKTVAALDEIPGREPDVAQLRDPTLDRFLANLEREPSIEARLGIPNRPRNLRVIAENMLTSEDGVRLGDAADEAIARAGKEMEEKPKLVERPKVEREMTEEERKQLVAAEDMKEMLKQKMLESMEQAKQKSQQETTSDDEKKRLERVAEDMKKMMQQMEDGELADNAWDKFAESEETAAMLRAVSRGEAIPDTQWNKLMSNLKGGLWQVRGRVPPEDYRKAIEQYQDSIRRLTSGVNDE